MYLISGIRSLQSAKKSKNPLSILSLYIYFLSLFLHKKRAKSNSKPFPKTKY